MAAIPHTLVLASYRAKAQALRDAAENTFEPQARAGLLKLAERWEKKATEALQAE